MIAAGMHEGVPGLDARAGLLAGVMEHVACYLQTGRPKSARLALMLLERLAQDQEAEPALREHAQHLRDVLEDRLSEAAPAVVCAGRPGPQSGPWLTWENLEAVA